MSSIPIVRDKGKILREMPRNLREIPKINPNCMSREILRQSGGCCVKNQYFDTAR
jgi:hypothetical protein